MRTVTVRFSTNRNYTGETQIFGNEIAHRGDPGRYRTGVVTMALTAPAMPDSGWSVVDGSLALDPEGEDARMAAAAAPAAARQEPAGSTVSFLASLSGKAATLAIGRAAAAPGFGLMLLPGFAASFLDTLRRTAQVATAYGAAEAYCFSWPANGRVSFDDYRSDQRDARDSAGTIAIALERLLAATDALAGEVPRIEIVAHSMGAFALRHAVQIIRAQRPELLRQSPFAGAFLMAADDDFDTLGDAGKLGPLLTLAKRVTVYTAGGDLALTASQIVNRFSRLGMFGPKDLAALPQHVTRVDVTAHSSTAGDVGESHFNHQYYRLAPGVIKDVRQVLAGKAPNRVKPRNPHPEGAYQGRAWLVPFFRS
jgi:esterase/lipase superfamily enzyme